MRTITTTTHRADAAHQAVPADASIPARLRGGQIGDLTIREERHNITDVVDALNATRMSNALEHVAETLRAAASLLSDIVTNRAVARSAAQGATLLLEDLHEQALLPAGARLAILRDSSGLIDTVPTAKVAARLAFRLLDEADALTVQHGQPLVIHGTSQQIDPRASQINGWVDTAAQLAARLNTALADSPQPTLDEARTIDWLDQHISHARTTGDLTLVDYLDDVRGHVLECGTNRPENTLVA